MTKTLLDIQDLTVVYVTQEGPYRAIQDLNLAVQHGEIVGVVGPSGSGKSSLLKALLRTLPPPGFIEHGRALFNGHDLFAMEDTALRAIRWVDLSVVMQNAQSALNPMLRVRDHFDDTLEAHGSKTPASRDRIETLLKRVQLPIELLDAFPHELSGGMQQRVCIALALLLKPDLVVLDECTTALDVLVEQDVIQLLRDLQAEMQFAVIAVSHDLPLLAQFAHRILLVDQGRIVASATSEDFRVGSAPPAFQAILAEIPAVNGPRNPHLLPEKKTEFDSKPELLQVRGLRKSFGEKTVLKDVHFHLNRGECLALVGVSGSGKSTIAKLLCGLLQADGGEIVGANRPRIQMVFQNPYRSLNPNQTLSEQLLRLLSKTRSKKEAKQRALQLLTEVDLHPAEQMLSRFPSMLSGGQRQRFAIARALCLEPHTLVLDEPTTMLDPPLRMGLLRTLSRIQRDSGMSMIFISHDLASARYFADRIAVLQDGRIVETGRSEDIAQAPKNAHTKELIQAAKRPLLDNASNQI